MSWLYSRVLVEEYLGATFLDGEQSVLSSLTAMPQAYLPPDKMMEYSSLSRFGMMYAPLTDDLGKELLMLYLEASRVRTLVPQEKEMELQAPEVDFGKKWHALSMKYDHDTFLLKTHHCLFNEVLPLSCVTLPQWGLMQDGEFWEQMISVGIMSGSAAGYWPTPLKEEGPGMQQKKLTDAVAIAEGFKPRYYQAPLMEDRQAFTGKVNPEWAEWLMGWPMGWTNVLTELEMDKFRQWQQQHGMYLQDDLIGPVN